MIEWRMENGKWKIENLLVPWLRLGTHTRGSASRWACCHERHELEAEPPKIRSQPETGNEHMEKGEFARSQPETGNEHTLGRATQAFALNEMLPNN